MRGLTDLRPPRARCPRCLFRFEIVGEAKPGDQLVCAHPHCRLLIPIEWEPTDESWWAWASGQVVQGMVSNVTLIGRPAPPAKPQRSIGVQV